MPATYTSYYAISEGNKQETPASSQRSSASSASQNQGRRSSLAKFFDSFRPADEATTQTGIYSPLVKKGPFFSRKQSSEEQKARDERHLRQGKNMEINMTPEMRDFIRAAA
ncbi:hypothetical protein DV737_g3218, partial [Chaetothyriales sp. CBS 132003]